MADAGRRRAETAGRSAETATAILMMARGFRILSRRLRTPVGEIDIVARRGRTVVFVEVKRRATTASGLESVTPRGKRRIADAARWWLAKHPAYDGYTLRFDVVVWAPWRLPRTVANAFDTTP